MSKQFHMAGSALALAVSSAFAQSPSSGSTGSSYQLATLDPVVVTASKVEEPQGQATVLIDVIHKDEIEESGAISVTELLDRIPGISIIRQYGRLGIDAAIDVGYLGGGSAQRTLIMVDGVRVNDIDEGTVSLGSVPLSVIERIEIRRAGGGVLFGDRALGGVINIITKPEKRDKTEFKTSVGSSGLKTVGASISRLAGAGSTHLDVQRANLDGYRRESWQAQTSILGRVILPTKLGEMSLTLRGSDEDLRLPYSISLATYNVDPRNPGLFITNSKRESRSGVVSLDTQINSTFRTALKFGSESLDRVSVNSFGNIRYSTDRNTFLLDGSKQYGKTLLLFGAEFFDAESGSTRTNRSKVTQTSNAVFVSVEQSIIDSKLMLGVRSQEMRNEFLPTAASPSQTSKERLMSWSLALKHPVMGGIMRGGLQSSFAFPNADQLFTFDGSFTPVDIYPGVKPMKSEEAQVGWTKERQGDRFEVSIRKVLVKDEIGLKYNCVGLNLCNDNLYDTNRAMLSASYRYRVGQSSSAYIAADLVDAEIDSGDFAGKRPSLIPRRILKVGASTKVSNGTLTLSAQYRDAMYSIDDSFNDGPRIPGRTLVDVGWAGDLTRSFAVQAWVRNLSNERYYDFASELNRSWGGVAPGDGRSVELVAKYRF